MKTFRIRRDYYDYVEVTALDYEAATEMAESISIEPDILTLDELVCISSEENT